jgi:hypothetical protein
LKFSEITCVIFIIEPEIIFLQSKRRTRSQEEG